MHNKSLKICTTKSSKNVQQILKRIKKYDILKTSQEYFEKTYNGASKIELFFLKVFRYLTRFLLLIKYLVD